MLHSSFLVRCWRLSSGIQRVEIEHIQSGAKARFRTILEGVDWIEGKYKSVTLTETAPLPDRREDEEVV
jgi:hypothetical protein